MNVLLITETLSSNFEPKLIKELNKIDINVEVIDVSKNKDFNPKKYDLVYSRMMPYENCGLLSYYISKIFEIRGSRFVDTPDNVLTFQNKLLCYELLKDKVPMLESELLLPKSKLRNLLNKNKIYKPILGRAGYYVEKIRKTSPKLLSLYKKRLEKSYKTYPFLIEDYINFDKLVRVFILNKKPLFALSSTKTNWKTSIYENVFKFNMDSKLKKYSNIVAKEINLNIGAFDFFYKNGEYLFNEFNYCCDLPRINNILGYNLHKKVAKVFKKLV